MTLEELRTEYVGDVNNDRIAEYLRNLFAAVGSCKSALNDLITKVGSYTAAQLAGAVAGLTLEKAQLLIDVKAGADAIVAVMLSEIAAGRMKDDFNLNAQI